MLRMTARRHWGLAVQGGADTVVFGLTLPSGSVVHNVSGMLAFINGTLAGDVNLYDMTEAFWIGVEGWVLPIDDPDAQATYDELWDRYVPKDTDSDVLDLDTAGQDVAPFFEPGELAFANLFDVGVQPRKVFSQQVLMTSVSGALWKGQPIVVARDIPLYVPGGQMGLKIGRPFRTGSRPMVLVYAFGSPDMDDTSAVVPTILSEQQLPQVKYMEDTLTRALLDQMNIVAGEPWDAASALLKKHLNPDVYEMSSNGFPTSSEWAVFGHARVDHSVTGQMRISNVSTGR